MVTRKTWDSQTKAEVVIQGLTGRPVSELCEHFGICPSQYYKWRDLCVERLPNLFESQGRSGSEATLARENERLKKLVGELTLALNRPGPR